MQGPDSRSVLRWVHLAAAAHHKTKVKKKKKEKHDHKYQCKTTSRHILANKTVVIWINGSFDPFNKTVMDVIQKHNNKAPGSCYKIIQVFIL